MQAIRAEIRAQHPELPLIDLRTQVQQINRQIAQPMLFAQLSGAFGVVVSLLVAIGLYGLISYSVLRRNAEIGVRMALGAQRGDILRLIWRDSLGLIAMGVGVGAVGALATGRFLASRLYGLSSTDPATYIVIGVSLIGIAALASWIPAHRATKVDPVVALRLET